MLKRLFFPRVLVRPSPPLLPTASRRVLLAARTLRTSPPRLTTPPPASTPPTTVSQRLQHLVKSYGWYALGVYLAFSALDFTVAFVGIKLLGAEQVSQAAAYVRQLAYGVMHSKPPEPGRDEMESAPAGSGSHDGLYAMLVLAYTIHKTVFLPVRVGLTATLTPRIVGWLRARGWAGGQGAARAAKEMRERTRITRDQD